MKFFENFITILTEIIVCVELLLLIAGPSVGVTMLIFISNSYEAYDMLNVGPGAVFWAAFPIWSPYAVILLEVLAFFVVIELANISNKFKGDENND